MTAAALRGPTAPATPETPAPAPDPAGPPPDPTDPTTADAYRLFRSLASPDEVNARQPTASHGAFTAFVTLWLLLVQRLHGGASLNDALSHLLFLFPEDDLPDCKRLADDRLSANTGAYSRARFRLERDLADWLADHAFTSLSRATPPSWKGRRVMLLDGTTFSLPSSRDLRLAFPPASNQYGESHWPVLLAVVAHDLDSGLVCRPAYAPMYGDDRSSEAALAGEVFGRLPNYSLILGDGNFGIFAVAYQAHVRGTHDVLFRLTRPRFAALIRQGETVGVGRWAVTWRPSAEERKKYPDLPADAEVRGFVAEIPDGPGGEPLYLFTTLTEGTTEEWAELYRRRWCVETDIGAGKDQLGLGRITARSKEMVEKELVLASVAYNLVVQVRRAAARQAGVEPRRLSFAGVASLVKAFEAKVAAGGLTEEGLQRAYDRLLRACGQRKVPGRPGRQAPRELIPRRRRYPERKRCPPGAAPPGAGAFAVPTQPGVAK